MVIWTQCSRRLLGLNTHVPPALDGEIRTRGEVRESTAKAGHWHAQCNYKGTSAPARGRRKKDGVESSHSAPSLFSAAVRDSDAIRESEAPKWRKDSDDSPSAYVPGRTHGRQRCGMTGTRPCFVMTAFIISILGGPPALARAAISLK